MIKAVFFDVDGTIVASKDLLLKAFNLALVGIGEEPVDEKIFEMAKSKELGTISHYIVSVLGKSEKKAKMYALFMANYEKLLKNEVELIPGTLEIFQKLRENGIKIGIQTTQYRAMLDIILNKFTLNPDASVARDEVVDKKPAPDQILKLCELLSVSPEESLVVGDWIGDIEAGRAAGAQTLGVLTGLSTGDELAAAGADNVFQDINSVIQIVFPGENLPQTAKSSAAEA